MTNAELKKIIDDICDTANNEFSTQNKTIDQKIILCDGKKIITDIESFSFCVGKVMMVLQNHSAYIELLRYFESLSSVKAIIPIAGYNTQPETMIGRLMVDTFHASEQRFSSERLLQKLDELIEIISKEYQEFTIAGRLHGVNLEIDLIELEPNISLIRLNENDINERQPLINDLFSISSIPTIRDYSDSNVEIRIKKSYKIVPNIEGSYFDTNNEAESDLQLKLDNVVKAIKLYHPGNYQIYPMSVCSPLMFGIESAQSRTSEPRAISAFNNVIFSNADIDSLRKTFYIVRESMSDDNVLKRSFLRFLIGIDEPRPEERLVDFVIAWESLLLTVNGTDNHSELNYRFSLNGASVSVAVNNTLDFDSFKNAFNLMKGAYDIRSTIVHGGDKEAISKKIKKLNSGSIDELNNQLSELYRKVIFWLTGIKKEDRPYMAKFGWEKLLMEKNN